MLSGYLRKFSRLHAASIFQNDWRNSEYMCQARQPFWRL